MEKYPLAGVYFHYLLFYINIWTAWDIGAQERPHPFYHFIIVSLFHCVYHVIEQHFHGAWCH